MDLFGNLALGLATAVSVQNLAYCFVGVLLGTLIGVLPGIGPVATIAMLLPVTYALEPTSALIMLAGIFYGAQYGGSTTAFIDPLDAAHMSIAIDTAGTDRPGLQRLLDSLWYAVLRDELVGREAERRSKVDIGALTKQVASLLPDVALSEVPSPIHVAPESGRCGQSATFVIGIHRFWPCAASGPPPEPLAEALDALLHRFLAPEASAMLRKRVDATPNADGRRAMTNPAGPSMKTNAARTLAPIAYSCRSCCAAGICARDSLLTSGGEAR